MKYIIGTVALAAIIFFLMKFKKSKEADEKDEPEEKEIDTHTTESVKARINKLKNPKPETDSEDEAPDQSAKNDEAFNDGDTASHPANEINSGDSHDVVISKTLAKATGKIYKPKSKVKTKKKINILSTAKNAIKKIKGSKILFHPKDKTKKTKVIKIKNPKIKKIKTKKIKKVKTT